MSISSRSRKPPPRHFGEVLDRIAADETLTRGQRNDRTSALRAMAKVLQLKLEEVPAHPAFLRDRLKNFTPVMAGIKDRRWDNVRSLTGIALEHVGIIHMPGRSRKPFAPEWTALFRPIKKKGKRIALSRFARLCTTRSIPPEQVNDATFQTFLDDLTMDSMVKLPHRVQRRAAVVWNEMAAKAPSWPKQLVMIPDHRRDYAACMIETWSSPFAYRPDGALRVERGRWTERLMLGFLFDDIPSDMNRVTVSPGNPAVAQVNFEDFSDYAKKAADRIPQMIDKLSEALPIERLVGTSLGTTAAHIQGTVVMGNDPATSVVDRHLVHHQFRNLLVLGSSAYPTASPAYPTLTVSALSLWAADHVLGRSST